MKKEENRKPKVYHPETHVRDVNSHRIFKNETLTSQFLREYTGLPIFGEIKSEDIEDVTERFYAFLGVEFEVDSVKKVKVKVTENNQNSEKKDLIEIIVISLIEHKSKVDYDVAMQLLRYMAVIWHEYKMDKEKETVGISKTKDFRYPIILPIVYYEGKDRWTAGMHLADRISHGEFMKKYLPDFTYKVVGIHDFTNEELEKKGDEISLVMMLNKIQDADDYKRLISKTDTFASKVYQTASPEIQEILRDIIWSLLMKLNVSKKEAQLMINHIKEDNNMGYLYENADFSEIHEVMKKRNKILEEIEQSEVKNRDIQQQIAQGEVKNRDIQQQIAQGEVKNRDIQQQIAQGEVKNRDIQQQIAQGEVKNRDIQQQIAQGEVKNRDIQQQITQGEVKNRDIQQQIAQGEEVMKLVKEKIRVISEEEKALEDRVNRKKLLLEELEKKIEAVDKKL